MAYSIAPKDYDKDLPLFAIEGGPIMFSNAQVRHACSELGGDPLGDLYDMLTLMHYGETIRWREEGMSQDLTITLCEDAVARVTAAYPLELDPAFIPPAR